MSDDNTEVMLASYPNEGCLAWANVSDVEVVQQKQQNSETNEET